MNKDVLLRSVRFGRVESAFGALIGDVIVERPMFVVREIDAAAIRAAYERDGELAAAAEVGRRYAGVTDNVQARAWARTIAGWPLPEAGPRRRPRRASPGKGA